MRVLSERGFRVAPPEKGDLACGYEATGPHGGATNHLRRDRHNVQLAMGGQTKVLVSTGGHGRRHRSCARDLESLERQDGICRGRSRARDLGSQVNGGCGAQRRWRRPTGLRIVHVRTSAEMSQALEREFKNSDALFMVAAVSDFKSGREARPEEEVRRQLVARAHENRRRARASLGRDKGSRVVVGFALGTEDEEQNARAKLAKKHCDLVVLNRPDAAFGQDTNVVLSIYDATVA
jgi:phosphopantothenoylcysteine decarboxylase/phosphopantothenate--cysteine ligase